MTTNTPSSPSHPLLLLVVVGAGYIGSHMLKHLSQRGCDVVTFDDLSPGHRDAVLGGEFVLGDLADWDALDAIFSQHAFDAMFHIASFIQVGESVTELAKHCANNVVNTLNLLDAMVAHGSGASSFHPLQRYMANWPARPSTRCTPSSRSTPAAKPSGWSSRFSKTTTAPMALGPCGRCPASRGRPGEAGGQQQRRPPGPELAPARFDLVTIIEDAWKWECKDRPASLVEPKQLRA